MYQEEKEKEREEYRNGSRLVIVSGKKGGRKRLTYLEEGQSLGHVTGGQES